MNKKNQLQIITAGISSLDEARYFAARGSDWLGFNIRQLGIADIKAIADWVVGPKLFLEITEVAEDLLFEISNTIDPDALCFGLSAALPGWYKGMVIRRVQLPTQPNPIAISANETLWIVMDTMPKDKDHIKSLQDLCQRHHCWISGDGVEFSPAELLNAIPAQGIAIRSSGNSESAYQQYDVFFDQIEEMRESN